MPLHANSFSPARLRGWRAMVEAADPAAATAGEGTAEGPTFECAICWQDVCGEPAALPCCGRAPAGSTTVYCTRCLEIICETYATHGSSPRQICYSHA